MKIAVVQMTVTDGESEANVGRAVGLIQSAPAADLYLLPELWTSGYLHERWANIADHETPQAIEEIGNLARLRRCFIGGSMICRHDDGGLVNRFLLHTPDGGIHGYYDKSHLFQPMQEHRYLRPGVEVPIWELNGFRVAPAICYDLRFSRMFANLAERDVDIFLVPSEWPKPRCASLRVLAQARAIESQAYLALSNRIGPASDGTDFCGQSRVIDPLGAEIVADGESLVLMDIDRELITKTRSFLKVLEDRVAGVDA